MAAGNDALDIKLVGFAEVEDNNNNNIAHYGLGRFQEYHHASTYVSCLDLVT